MMTQKAPPRRVMTGLNLTPVPAERSTLVVDLDELSARSIRRWR